MRKKLSQKELRKRLDALPNENEIRLICTKCGESRYNKRAGCATWHKDQCGVCKTEQMVTEPRDFRMGKRIT
jgi:uncharacterized OB-fold protein